MDNKIAELRKDDLEILKEYIKKGKLEKGFFPLASYDMVQSGYPRPTEGLMIPRLWGGINGDDELLSGRGMWCKVDDVKTLLAKEKETTKNSGLHLNSVVQQRELLINFLWQQYKVEKLITKKQYLQMTKNVKLINCG